MTLADALRYAAIVLALLTIGFTIAVAQEVRQLRLPLPSYLRLVLVSFALAQAALIVEVHRLLGTPLTWRSVFVLGSVAFGLAAMVSLWWHARPRHSPAAPEADRS